MKYPRFHAAVVKALFSEMWKDTWPLWVIMEANEAARGNLIPESIIRTLRTNMLSEAAIKTTKYTTFPVS